MIIYQSIILRLSCIFYIYSYIFNILHSACTPTMDSVEWTIKNSDYVPQFTESIESQSRMIHSASPKMENSPFISTMSQKYTLHIGLNLGRILYSVQILIVSKLTQKVTTYLMQNWGKTYKFHQVLIIFCTLAGLNKNTLFCYVQILMVLQYILLWFCTPQNNSLLAVSLARCFLGIIIDNQDDLKPILTCHVCWYSCAP